MASDDENFDQLEGALENKRFEVRIGAKGILITSHSNPRALRVRDFYKEFTAKVGEEEALEAIERFVSITPIRVF